MANMETLYCVIGDHNWQRQRLRGRKPINCPDHKPEPIAAKVTVRRPDAKPKPAKQAQPTETVTLFCEAGQHEWQRPRQRGKKPVNCPEHKAQIATVEKPLAPVIDIESVRSELATLSARGQTALSEYETALEATRRAKTKDEITHSFNAADRAQNAVLNISRRKETLTLQLQRAS